MRGRPSWSSRGRLMPGQKICANGRNARWRHVEAHRNPLQFRTRRGIKLHHERIVTWNDMALVRCKREQPLKSFKHLADMERGGKRPFARHVLVEMTDVRGQHDEPPAGPDAN